MNASTSDEIVTAVVLPIDVDPSSPLPTPTARAILDSLQALAEGVVGSRVVVLGPGQITRENWAGLPKGILARLYAGIRHAMGSARRPLLLAMLHPSFLTRPNPNLSELFDKAKSIGTSACYHNGELYAFAAQTRIVASNPGLLQAVATRLSASGGTMSEGPFEIPFPIATVRAFESDPASSPAMDGVANPALSKIYDAPSFLNEALGEVFRPPTEVNDRMSASSDSLAADLRAHRDRSAVPWIFNELLNEIEFKAGSVLPMSFPPEFHLSTTGVCNIECKFCSYTHSHSRKDVVTKEMIERLGFLRHVRTLRLHSGNGDPTANRHLAAIVGDITRRYPHIAMNFFTNGVLLDRRELIPALVGSGVAWINVSLNAASPQMWRELCGSDQFSRVCNNLRELLREKRERQTANPVVFASMVLTRKSVFELPLMPALCRELGIDRFTAIPFFSLGYDATGGKYGPDDTYHRIGSRYDSIYHETVTEARAHRVSVELPLPSDAKQAAFGVEQRVLHDFAYVESHDWRLGRLFGTASDSQLAAPPCHYLWRQAAVGSTSAGQGGPADTHFLYPCLGPLATIPMVSQTAFDFPDEDGFQDLWRNPLFTLLRKAQHTRGLSRVCDACRGCDTRDPDQLPGIERLVSEFRLENGLV